MLNNNIEEIIKTVKFYDHTNDVTENSMFFALPGKKADNSYINSEKAILLGAKFIVAWKSVCDLLQKKYPNIHFIPSSNPRATYTQACKTAANYKETCKMIAITGTKGKTSAAYLLNCLAQDQNNQYSSAYIGTLGVFIDKNKCFPNKDSLTCPTPMELYKNIAFLESQKVNNIVLEYTSIAIDGFRCIENFDIGVLTNFTGDDHLIYHTTVENYMSCKLMMFEKVKQIVCYDQDPLSQILQHRYPEKPFYTYSLTNSQAFCYIKHEANISGFDVKIFISQKLAFQGQINLLGDFQLLNLACAITCFMLLNDFSLSDLANKLTQTHFYIPGRMEIFLPSKIKSADDHKKQINNDNIIILDYAHTPHSLEEAFKSILKHGYSNIIVVFGCGGNRDHEKRYLMGALAAKYAKHAIITDDNPRFEEPASIRKMILSTCPNGIEIGDRSKAIEYSFNLLKNMKNTALLIAGKGHEEYQIIENTPIPYSDKNTILGFLNEDNG